MVSLYNILTDTPPPRARPGPPRPSLASGGPPAAARCGGVTNPTTKHRDAVGRSEVQLGVCIAHPGLSPGPINRRLRRRGHEVLFTPGQAFMQHSNAALEKRKTLELLSRTALGKGMAPWYKQRYIKTPVDLSKKSSSFPRRVFLFSPFDPKTIC